eukprot:6492251-Amphidinium_carterae.2
MEEVQMHSTPAPSTPVRRPQDDEAQSNYLKGKGVPVGVAEAVLTSAADQSSPVGSAEFPASQRLTLEAKIDRLLLDNAQLLRGQQGFISRLSSLETEHKTLRSEIDEMKREWRTFRVGGAAGSIFARRSSDAGVAKRPTRGMGARAESAPPPGVAAPATSQPPPSQNDRKADKSKIHIVGFAANLSHAEHLDFAQKHFELDGQVKVSTFALYSRRCSLQFDSPQAAQEFAASFKDRKIHHERNLLHAVPDLSAEQTRRGWMLRMARNVLVKHVDASTVRVHYQSNAVYVGRNVACFVRDGSLRKKEWPDAVPFEEALALLQQGG